MTFSSGFCLKLFDYRLWCCAGREVVIIFFLSYDNLCSKIEYHCIIQNICNYPSLVLSCRYSTMYEYIMTLCGLFLA